MLKNRLLLIDPPKDERFVPISTQQAPNKYPTTSSSFEINNENIKLLVQTLGRETLSVKEMMVRLHLKDRVNFLTNYLSPSIQNGFVQMLYPESPRHPRQKYLLTVKGNGVFQ